MTGWRQRFAKVALLVLISGPATLLSCRSQEPESGGAREAPSFEGMIEIPTGAFQYGANEGHLDRLMSVSRINYGGLRERLRSMLVMPLRVVNVERFYIDEFEVTNGQFEAFMAATDYRPARPQEFLKHWEGRSVPPDWAKDFPVVWVSAEDGEAFCRWRGLRLPTDQEWERAARGTDGRIFPWGNSEAPGDGSNRGTGQLEPVGNRAGDLSADAVYDLGGNVSEWAALPPVDGAARYSIRGGSYASSMWDLFVYYRLTEISPSDRFDFVGFRCAGSP